MTYNYQQHEEDIAEANRLNKNAVFDALAAVGITEVAVEFDGWAIAAKLRALLPKLARRSPTFPKPL